MIVISVYGDHPQVRTWRRVQRYRVKMSFSARNTQTFPQACRLSSMDMAQPTSRELIKIEHRFKRLKDDAESLVVSDLLPAGDPDSFESRLLGTTVSAASPQVELANPIHYLRPGNAPFLILHGEADSLMPWQQSWLLFEALSDAEDDATLVLFEKLGHGFFNNPRLADFDYGKVKVHRSQTERASRAHWSCNVSAIFRAWSMSFFRAHLICNNEDL